MMEPQPNTICVDRLSTLPDELLHMILYFLPSPQVVQTCVLSKRWRGLWRSTTYVDIDDSDLGITENNHGSLEERWGKFEDFATNLLLFHECTPSLDQFSFSSHLYNRCHVDRWIHRGIEYCPATIQIQILDFSDHGRFRLPPVAGSSFRNLQTLSLSNLDLNNYFGGLLSSGCPVLGVLELTYCNFCDNYSQGITSSTLNNLKIGCCSNNSSHPLVITAPRLAYLCLVFGCYLAGILFYNMDSLVKAEIYINDYTLPNQESKGMSSRQVSINPPPPPLCTVLKIADLNINFFYVSNFKCSYIMPLFGIFHLLSMYE
jgi:hypothetical protein